MSNKVIRVLIAKPGLDGHDRGAKVVARGLRDAGFEVIYTGLHQTPEMVVQSAIQEDVDVVGLSILSGAHIPLVKAIQGLLKKEKVLKPIFVGGIIPQDDGKQLLKSGIKAVFGPGATMAEITQKIIQITTPKKKTSSKKSSKSSRAK
jgi:methylmalonyl-CoA mutase C-terminal domain/subunit